MSVQQTDVLVIGAGPAGCAAALALDPALNVTLLDREAATRGRIGETMPAAAGRILEELGHYVAFSTEEHDRSYARRSVWGDDQPIELDSMFDLDGPGWRLDRQVFERGLREAAVRRGALLEAPRSVTALERVSIQRGAATWRARLDDGRTISAHIVIDAAGRASRLARWTGAVRQNTDRLACAWQFAPLTCGNSAITYTQACEDGWWYSAPLPGRRRILAFHSDADLPVMGRIAKAGLTGFANGIAQLSGEIADADWTQASTVQLCAAYSARLDRFAGSDWAAIGDAATAFDPLSSQGLYHSLYTGLRVARLIEPLARSVAYKAYQRELAEVWAGYRSHFHAFYSAERRWPSAPFWQRRIGA